MMSKGTLFFVGGGYKNMKLKNVMTFKKKRMEAREPLKGK